jgi:FAD/FMN-containing dehydrogenase
MASTESLTTLAAELATADDLELLQGAADLQRYSKDAYDYSPILQPQLESCRADLVVRPLTVAGVERLAAACGRHGVPLTLRGSGTGNYGQSVPLEGGVVMLSGALREVEHLDPSTGVVTVQPGCLMRDLDQHLRAHGRQLRLLPSTWRSASIGGFLAGGSGGIGSIRWGFLRDPGHLLGAELITVEREPRRLQLDATEAEALNHAYGTNGILTRLQLATAPAVNWHQISIDVETWGAAVALLQRCTRSAVELHLATLLERSVLQCLPAWSGPESDRHRLLLLVAPDGVSTLARLAAASGAVLHDLGPEDLGGGQGLRDLSWNHTTLHMRSEDAGWTYLQMLLPEPELPAMEQLKQRWGDALLWHLEGVRQQGAARLAALPLVRWSSTEQLDALMRDCREVGAVLFNPHVITVEDGGLGVVDGDQVAAKHRYDPEGLLNPGKLRGWLESISSPGCPGSPHPSRG